MTSVELAGLGHYAPPRRVANDEIERRLGLEDGWIFKRTGIAARRFAADDEALSGMALAAGQMALANAGLPAKDIALLLLATSTPDHLLPPSAPLVAHHLGLNNSGSIDLAGACGGFVYALTLADAYVRANGRPALVIAANILSRRINWKNRASSVLFADAAGAAVLRPAERAGAGVIGSDVAADGSGYRLIQIPGGGSRKPFGTLANADDTLMVIDDGKAVFAKAIAMMTSCAQAALKRAKLESGDVTHFIPHQANVRMMAQVAHRLGIPQSQMLSTVAEFANSSAATIPFTWSMAAAERPFRAGDVVLMTAAGAGLTGGAVAFRV